MSRPKSVVVVGGSVTGLMHGLSLSHPSTKPSSSSSSPTAASAQSPPPNITILERSPGLALQSHGAGLVLRPEFSSFLSTHLTSLNRPSSSPSPNLESLSPAPPLLVVTSRARQYLNLDGEVIDSEPRAQPMISWDLLWNALRFEFDGGGDPGFVDAFGEIVGRTGGGRGAGRRGTYVHDAKVVDVELLGDDGQGGDDGGVAGKGTGDGLSGTGGKDQRRGSVRVTYIKTTDLEAKRQHLYADLVIAADGASSKVRELLFDKNPKPPPNTTTPSSIESIIQSQGTMTQAASPITTNAPTTLTAPPTRTYAGYIAWRGSLPESALTHTTHTTLADKITFFHGKASGTQFISYLIPGSQGTVEPGHRTLSWCWYLNHPDLPPASSSSSSSTSTTNISLTTALTDTKGHRHSWSIPSAQLSPHVWSAIKRQATVSLPPQLAELVLRSPPPFGQAVTDSLSVQPDVGHGRVRLAGDALAGVRPHSAAGAALAAVCADALGRDVRGYGGAGGAGKGEGGEELDGEEKGDDRDERYERNEGGKEGSGLQKWRDEVMAYARKMSALGIELGERSRKGEHQFAV